VWISTFRREHPGASLDRVQSYLVEVYSPQGGRREYRAAIARLRRAAEAMTREGTPITYRRSLLLPEDETCFHIIEGTTRAEVAEAARRAAVNAARVVQAQP
jgi:hypothetical protein